MYPCCLTKTDWTLSYITGRTKFSVIKQSIAFREVHSTCLKPPIGGFRNLASRNRHFNNNWFKELFEKVPPDSILSYLHEIGLFYGL